jgi:hypothetical protein
VRYLVLALLVGCSAPERIASNAGDIRTLAESSRSRFVGHDDPVGVAEQTEIIEKAAAISVDATLVDPRSPAWQGTLELALWAGLAIALCVIVWQTGLGTMLRGLVGWIPQRQRSAAKLLREAVDNPNQIREAAAAVRTADPLINAAWKG